MASNDFPKPVSASDIEVGITKPTQKAPSAAPVTVDPARIGGFSANGTVTGARYTAANRPHTTPVYQARPRQSNGSFGCGDICECIGTCFAGICAGSCACAGAVLMIALAVAPYAYTVAKIVLTLILSLEQWDENCDNIVYLKIFAIATSTISFLMILRVMLCKKKEDQQEQQAVATMTEEERKQYKLEQAKKAAPAMFLYSLLVIVFGAIALAKTDDSCGDSDWYTLVFVEMMVIASMWGLVVLAMVLMCCIGGLSMCFGG